MIRYLEIAAEIPAVISEKGGLHVLEYPFAWIRMLHIFKLGNNRISTAKTMDNGLPLTVDNLVAALPESPLGGLQGGAGQLSLFGFTYHYAPGSFADTLVESFAGPHDWLNSSHYYGADGNISYASGIWGNESWNSLNVLLAAPMGISTLCTQAPGLCSSAQNAFNNSTNMSLHSYVVIQPPVVQSGYTKPKQGPQP